MQLCFGIGNFGIEFFDAVQIFVLAVCRFGAGIFKLSSDFLDSFLVYIFGKSLEFGFVLGNSVRLLGSKGVHIRCTVQSDVDVSVII